MTKCVCTDCGWRGTWETTLSAPNPFDTEDKLTGCPDCKSPETMRTACYADECWQDGSCGSVYPDGVYRWSCFKHSNLANSPAIGKSE
jgi:hypothetical protein